MASNSSSGRFNNGDPSTPDDFTSSPIGNTLSTPNDGPGRRRTRQRQSSSNLSTPRVLRSNSAAVTPSDATPTPSTSRRRGRGQRNDPTSTPVAATPSFTDNEAPASSEAGEAFDVDDAPPVYVWGTNISIQDVNAAILRFLRNFTESSSMDTDHFEGKYMTAVHHVLELEGEWLDVDARDVFDYDPDLYNKMVRFPLEVLAIFDMVLMDIISKINEYFEKHVQVRIFNLKTSTCMRILNPSDIEKMVALKGMVIRCSSIIPEIREAVFKCLVCGYYTDPIVVERGRIEEPTICAKEECQAKNSMTLVHNRCRFADKQIVRLQETPDEIPEGGTPHTVSLLMHDKLVDTAKPGDRVEVTGIYRAMTVRVGPTQRTVKSLFKTYIDCLHIKKVDKSRLQADDPMDVENGPTLNEHIPPVHQDKVEQLKELSKLPDIYDRLTKSLAPNIWELDDVKRGLLCQLFGGSALKLPSGASFRGDINVLLVGDPGTSKSQLLQYIHKLSPRGIYTSGRGSSAVGLTAYVTKDPETGETVLESGALVLSDRGICCIDEFDKMSDSARSMLHEVMEQQTVSIAKAGIIASLNARTSVLACANPSGSRYNPRLSVIENIHLPPTLLSRFDLIYLILDKADEQTDRRLAKHIVALHFDNPEIAHHDILDLPTLTSYVSYARKHIHPQLSDEAAEELTRGYVELRRSKSMESSSNQSGGLLWFFRDKGFDDKSINEMFRRCKRLEGTQQEKANESWTYLTSIGIQERKLPSIVMKCPKILTFGVDERLEPMVHCLQTLATKPNEVPTAIIKFPYIFSHSVEEKLCPLLAFFESHGIPDKQLGKMILLNPRIISYSIESKLVQFVEFLASLELNKDGMIGKILAKNPFLMGYSVSKRLQPTVDFLKTIGLTKPDLQKLTVAYPEVLCRDVNKTLKPNYDYLRSSGFEDKQIAALVSGYPPILIKSIKNSLEPKIRFLVEVMGRRIDEVVAYPDFFRYGLKKTLEFRQRIMRQNNIDCSLNEMLYFNQKKFSQKYGLVENVA